MLASVPEEVIRTISADGHARHDLRRQVALRLGGRAVAGAERGGGRDRRDHVRDARGPAASGPQDMTQST